MCCFRLVWRSGGVVGEVLGDQMGGWGAGEMVIGC